MLQKILLTLLLFFNSCLRSRNEDVLLALILFSVEQFRSAILERIKGNCATSAYGRTNFVEVGKPDYKYLGETYKTMMTRLAPGDYIISNPALRSLVKIKFPRPTYKESK